MKIGHAVKSMKSSKVALIAGALICALLAPATSQSADDWVAIKDPTELRAIYGNKTIRGVTMTGTAFVGHYGADGKGIMIFGDKRIPRTWRVKGNEQVCVTDVSGTACYVYWRHRDKQNAIKNMNVENGWTSEYTVEDGIPKF